MNNLPSDIFMQVRSHVETIERKLDRCINFRGRLFGFEDTVVLKSLRNKVKNKVHEVKTEGNCMIRKMKMYLELNTENVRKRLE
jgi:hypothetical protein